MQYEYDAIIVGSGVAGALCAWKLSTLGDYRILILEAGDNGIGEGQRAEFHHAISSPRIVPFEVENSPVSIPRRCSIER